MVPCFPLLGLTPSGLFMGLSSTIIYTSELILCSTICVPSATRHNIHMYPYFGNNTLIAFENNSTSSWYENPHIPQFEFLLLLTNEAWFVKPQTDQETTKKLATKGILREGGEGGSRVWIEHSPVRLLGAGLVHPGLR